MRDYTALATAATEKLDAEVDDKAGAVVLKLDTHLNSLTGFARLEFLEKLDKLMSDPSSLVATATASNGRPAVVLGSGASTTPTTTPAVSTDPLARRLAALPTPAAEAAIRFGEKFAAGKVTPLEVVALTNILDNEDDWKVTEDGSTGQPILEAVTTAQRDAAQARKDLRDLATKAENPLATTDRMLDSVRRFQSALPSDYPHAAGPDPAERDDLQRVVRDLLPQVTKAKRS